MKNRTKEIFLFAEIIGRCVILTAIGLLAGRLELILNLNLFDKILATIIGIACGIWVMLPIYKEEIKEDGKEK